jgi:hypothetical protein
MKSLQAGDWVRTASGDEGMIDLLSRLSAFIEFGGKPHSGPSSCLLSELTKIDPPTEYVFPASYRSASTPKGTITQDAGRHVHSMVL